MSELFARSADRLLVRLRLSRRGPSGARDRKDQGQGDSSGRDAEQSHDGPGYYASRSLDEALARAIPFRSGWWVDVGYVSGETL